MRKVRLKFLPEVLLTVTILVGAIVLFVRLTSTTRSLEEARTTASRETARATRISADLREVERILQTIPLDDGKLWGDTVYSLARRQEVAPQKRLLFALSESCRACMLTLPFLDSLEKELTGSVVAVSRGDPVALLSFAETNKLAYPVIRNASGSIVDRIPAHGTPVLVVFDSLRVRAIEIGAPDSQARRRIRRALGVTEGLQ